MSDERSEESIGSNALFGIWSDMKTAPKGGGAERVDDPKWVDPPRILVAFDGGEISIVYWDYYYDEGGMGYEGTLAWVLLDSGLAAHEYGNPVAWMPLPSLPNDLADPPA